MNFYMAGLVRWLDYIGIETSYSCDGHGERPPQIEVTSDVGIALWILRTRSSFFQKQRVISVIYQHPHVAGAYHLPARPIGTTCLSLRNGCMRNGMS